MLLRVLLFACLTAAPALQAAAPDLGLQRLASLLSGTFSSAEQAAADKNFRHVVLHVVRIWPERADGPWLYVEQALAEAVDQPYRQRVYQLIRRADGIFESRVFTLPDPVAATGAWRKSTPLAEISPATLVAREGCTVFLREMPDGSFVGSTDGNGCASELRGATYATSEVTLTSTEMISWDRGFNAAGKQVWGATTGGYRFKRTLPAEPPR